MRRSPHAFALVLCVGLAFANVGRVGIVDGVAVVGLLAGAAVALPPERRRAAVALGLAIAGWSWGSARLEVVDRSALASRIGTAERARLVVTGPPRVSRFDTRVPATVVAWGGAAVREPVLLKLPPGRAPPQGAIVELVGELAAPSDFERTRLRHHGVHVVVRSME